LRQTFADGLVDARIVHLALERTFTPSPLRFVLRLRGIILISRAVPAQLAADGGRRARQCLRNFC